MTTEQILELEKSVLFDTPEELDKTCKRLGNLKQGSRALALACQFRGLEWVKVLVNNNVGFKFVNIVNSGLRPYKNPQGAAFYGLLDDFMFALLDQTMHERILSMQHNSYYKANTIKGPTESIIAFDKLFLPVSKEERMKSINYFIELNDNNACDLQRLLYLAVIHLDKQAVRLLREKNITLSEDTVNMLVMGAENNNNFFWYFCRNLRFMNSEEFVWTIEELSKDLDEGRITTSTMFFDVTRKIFYEPRVFECILDHFNQKRLNQKKTMQEIISLDKPELLAICEKNGWLKMPKKRDELIQFAADNNKTESTAWLLDFKNRTADIKAEREKAEKRLMHQLNADPNSVTELKKIWGFEKRDDGGIAITRYKGKRTQVDVPEKIGGMTVKEIGETAFSPEALRIKSEHRDFLKTVTKVNLPQTVEVIGNKAFSMCEGLTEINIPHNVKKIGTAAFFCCKIVNLEISEGISEIGSSAFAGCKSLISAELPEGITEISGGTFSGCEALQKAVIPATVKKIEKWAFLRCFSLEEIIIPNGVEEIGEKAFAYCSKLKSLTLPQSVNKIKNYTHKGHEPETIFSENKNLTVTVPAKSYSEKYCKRNNIPYIISEED